MAPAVLIRWNIRRKATTVPDMETLFGTDWSAVLHEALLRVMAPFVSFLFPESMFYWPYLLSGLAIAAIAFVLTHPRRDFSFAAMLKAAGNPRIWFAKSARADYRYYVVNGILYPMLTAPIALSGLGLGIVLSDGIAALRGPLEEPALGPTALRIAYTIGFFVCLDFGRFLAHYALHKVPLLWEFHKVHHSAEVLTPITSGRLHPVDLFVMGTGEALGAAAATGFFFYIGAGEVTVYTALGLHVALMAYYAIGNLRHSHVWVSYGPLSYVFISPAQHQIHHSRLPKHFDRNCGFGLAIWDWMFGTLYVPKRRETFPMGLGDGSDGTWHSVRDMYFRPFANAYRLLRPGPDKSRIQPAE